MAETRTKPAEGPVKKPMTPGPKFPKRPVPRGK